MTPDEYGIGVSLFGGAVVWSVLLSLLLGWFSANGR